MTVKQLSVFLDDRSGGIEKLADTLGNARLSIRAMTLNDNPSCAIFRMVVHDTERAISLLTQVGFQVQVTDVLAVHLEDRPGSLAEVARALADADVEVHYMYATFARSPGSAFVILKPSNTDRATSALLRAGVEVLDAAAF